MEDFSIFYFWHKHAHLSFSFSMTALGSSSPFHRLFCKNSLFVDVPVVLSLSVFLSRPFVCFMRFVCISTFHTVFGVCLLGFSSYLMPVCSPLDISVYICIYDERYLCYESIVNTRPDKPFYGHEHKREKSLLFSEK